MAGAGSNLSQTNPALLKRVTADLEHIIKAHFGKGPVPVDLLTSSSSGLDPDISVAAAEYQIERIALARGLTGQELRIVIQSNMEERTFGFLGEKRVNVLKLNLALDFK